MTDHFAAQEDQDFLEKSQSEQMVVKAKIREKEARSFCTALGATPVFWDLPFYRERRRNLSKQDVACVLSSIKKLHPEVVFVIDEASDPHGTHGLVQKAVEEALVRDGYQGVVLGYRVWEGGYGGDEGDSLIRLAFDEEVMAEKERLISFYRSQIVDPAYPHKELSFIELVRRSNAATAKEMNQDLPYVESFKFL